MAIDVFRFLEDPALDEESGWIEIGLTPEDLAEWEPPGLPIELECEALLGFGLIDY